MPNDLNIRIKINSDTKALEVTQDGIEKIRQKSGEASNSVNVFEGSLGKVAALTATGLGFAGLTASVSSFIETSGKFEQYAVSLKVLSGSAEKAEKSLAWVKDFTAKTPYTLDQTMEAFIRLKAYGIDATDGSLKVLGDTASALGKPLMASVEAMADAMTGENERLKEFGITAKMSGDTIAYNWIDSSGQAKTKIIDNNKQIIKSTLEAIFNEKYAGMMDEQAKTWVGAVSNLEDSWTSLKDTIARDSGMFDSAKSAISGLNTLISNQNGELDTFGRYLKDIAVFTGSATAAITLYYGAQKMAAWYTGASAVATTSYNAATNLTTTSVIRLTAAQVALNGATAIWNRLLAVNPLILAGMAIAGGIAYFYDMAQKADQDAKRSYAEILKMDKAYADYYSTAEGKAAKMGSSYSALEQSLQSLQKQRNSATGDQASRLDQAIASTKKQMDAIQSSAKNLYVPVDNVSPHTLSDKEIKALEKKRKEAERQAKEQYDLEVKHLDLQQNATLDYYKTIGDASSVYAIEEAQKLQTLASAGILTNEQMIDVWLKDNETFAWQNSELERETDKKILATHIKTIEDKRAALLDYYTQIGDISSAFEIRESDKIQKLAELGIYTNEQMLAIWTKDNEAYQKDQFEKNNKFWVGLFDNVNKAMESQFFDVMTGRFNSFGSWLKDLWSSITDSMSRGLSKTLADAILGTGTDSGGLQNIFKTYGGLGSVFGSSMTPSALLGSSMDSAGFTTTTGGTVFDAAGQITKSGSDAESVISALSNAKSLYSIATDGITGYMGGIAGNLANAAGWLNGMGFTAGGNFLTGAGSIFAGNGMLTSSTASMLGGGLTAGALGGVGGYALGSLGDALFGANTKAASYGAIGGSIGAIAGSIVPGLGTLLGGAIGSALGSVIGGMFGSTKATGSGYYFNSDTTTGSNGQSYIDYKKKSWFSSSSWTDYTNLSDVDKLKVKGMFDTYNYLFTQLGSSNIVELSAGKYSGTKFQDELAKDFIAKYIGIDKTISVTTTELIRSFGKRLNISLLGATEEVTKITDNPEFTKIYAYWTDYAKSINKTVAEALTSSVGTYISETRTFSEWKFGSGTVDQLKFTADYLAKDLAALETQMGVSGVTVDNYLSMYDEAIKKSFTPETISSWKALGDAIMSNTDAADAYTNALKEQAAVSSKMAHQDMLLSKVTSVAKNEGESLSAQLLVQVVKELQSLRTDTLFQVDTA